MDKTERDYNLEDTGRLMTESRSGGSKKKMILILIAVISVAAVAVLGFRAAGEKRYNDQIAIAEKAMKEGSYEQAEEEYLKAVSMNKHRIEAREGLAYAYAVQGKFDEAKEIYDGLSKETNDPKYVQGSIDSENGMVSVDPDLTIETAWHEVELKDIPYSEFVKYFVSRTGFSSYGYDGTQSYTAGEISHGEYLNDWFSMAFFGDPITMPAEEYRSDNYDWTKPEDVTDGNDITEPDPRGWFVTNGDPVYTRADKSRVDDDLKRTFGFNDEQIELIVQRGEDAKGLYTDGGHYYELYWWMSGRSAVNINVITKIRTNGISYCAQYEAGMMVQDGSNSDYESLDYSEPHHTYYEILEYKKVDGQTYLSMSYNGPEEPEELREQTAAVLNGWTVVDPADIPDKADLDKFILWYTVFPLGRECEFDSSREEGETDLYMSHYLAEQMKYPGWDNGGQVDKDPRGLWQTEYYGCWYQEKESFDWVVRNIFNCTEERINAMLKADEEAGLMYLDAGRYYILADITGIGIHGEEITEARTDGERYLIKYDTGMPADNDDTSGRLDRTQTVGKSYYAVVQLKTIDGRDYWTMYYNGKDIPDNL